MLAAGRGGVENMALYHHLALAAQGCDVRSIGDPAGRLAEGLADQSPYVFAPFRARTAGDPFSGRELQKLVASLNPDLMLIHGARALRLATSWPRLLRIPTALVVHNFRLKRELRLADRVIAVSPAVGARAESLFPDADVTVVQNFGPLRISPVREAFGDPPVLGAFGRLHTNKGLDLLIEAAAILKRRRCAFRIKIAGDGPEDAALKALARRLDVSDRIDFLGWLDPTDFFPQIDVLVSSSRVEPFGLVVIEAMAAGVPVIATAIDGPDHILQHGLLGALTAPEAPAIADAIDRALREPGLALDRARSAQDHAEAFYGMEAGGERLWAALKGLVRPAADA